jgi:hypothetical protein
VKKETYNMPEFPTLENLSGELARLTARAGAWVASVHPGRGPHRSGVLWDAEHVLTAEHGLGQAETVEVGLPGGQAVSATVLGRMPGVDLALLRLPESVETPPPPWREGAPGGLVVSLGRNRRGGLVASLGILCSTDGGLEHRSGFAPEFSGGPLLDCGGGFLGLNGHGRPREAAPLERLRRAVEEMRQGRSVEPGFLGLGLLAMGSGGCLVIKVEPGGPAEKSGVMVGDQLLRLEGAEVNGPEDVHRELRFQPAGGPVTLALARAGQPLELRVELAARPHRGDPHQHGPGPGGAGRRFFRHIRKAILEGGPAGFGPGCGQGGFGPPGFGPPEQEGRHRGGPGHRPRHGPPGPPPPPEVC